MNTLFQAFVFPGLLYVIAWTVGLFWFFRKFMAPLHKRVGPHFNGLAGSYQTLFDLSKLLSKESITPEGVNPYLFSMMPLIALIVAMLPAAFIPWTASYPAIPSAFGLLALIVLIGIEPFLLFLTGFGSDNKYSFLGGIRVLTQAISMETAFFLAALSPALLFGTMDLKIIVEETSWLSVLILLPAFFLYFIALLGLLEQPPFNIPDAEQEIVYGFYTEYSGTNYFLLKMAEFSEFMAVFAGAATLFLGAYKGVFFDGYFWFFLKMLMIAVLMMTIRAATPRITMKQMLSFSWRYLVPVSLLNMAWIMLARTLFLGGA
ncbi:complex I subunit 1/NuoH family protein [Sulfurovum sp. NBC37-1]|uniref:complex I subunit 1/NuoH family protein n=1 Tax=Sulfurovum sp. (strain NBC37-1) TaxID=387093 RepID=UPI000158755E|nr:complex I subunit 1 family protein [Sulfurovum sp. NBC37-1]BAF71805.1 NADH-quinone oxidoreductase, chain H [Sulfurovum sp. NBC37-1]